MNIGKNIRNLRKSKGIKQKDIAKQAGISNSFLCDIEAGRNQPSISTLLRIADALEIDVTTLFE